MRRFEPRPRRKLRPGSIELESPGTPRETVELETADESGAQGRER